MARLSVVWTGPASSTGSPITLMMRPRVSSPTGTEIGSPVSLTSWPRTRPSDVSIAMVRTVDSPRCWATSSTRRFPPFLVSSAFKIAGRGPSNCTSTTAPITWVMRPVWLVPLAIAGPCYLFTYGACGTKSQRLGAGNDLDQFLRDHRLARTVVGQRLLADHFTGVAGGIIHRTHLRAVERGGILQQRTKHLDAEVTRQELGQDLFFLGLEFVSGTAGSASRPAGRLKQR